MTVAKGRLLSGRYRLVKPVGQGAQASVWIADHLALGTQVAVKLIDPELAKQSDALQRFKREATAAAHLRSAHVVQILDHGVDGAQPFIVMELLEGEDLFERIQKRKRLTLKETSTILTQVSRALTRAHASGIVHRDLKPENVFLVPNDDDEVAKVLDFGVAKVSDPAKRTMQRTGIGTLIGTPHYMSPEQVKGVAEVDHRTDIWALGVITYQCLTGELPFDSEGVGDLLIKITIADLPVPSRIVPTLPAAFDAWFAKICDREPANRFDTAKDAAEALARIVGLETGAPASSPQPDAPVESERRPVVPRPTPAKEAARPPIAGVTPPSDDVVIEVAHSLLPPPRPPMESLDSIDIEMGDSIHPPPPPGPEDPLMLDEATGDSDPARPSDGLEVWVPPPREVAPAAASQPTPIAQPPISLQTPSSTVSGLASSGLSSLPPPELDGSRKRRTRWMLALAFAGIVGTVAWFTIRPNLETHGTAASPQPIASAVVPVPTADSIDAPVSAPMASAVDPGKSARKPSTASPAAPPKAQPAKPRPRSKPASSSDLPLIDIPDPDDHGPEPKSPSGTPPAPGGPPPAPEE